MSYIDVTGKTEEEAIRKGLEQLGMDRDDVSVEILERAKSGFLGIGSNPARVRLTYGPEEAPVAEPAPVVKPVVQKPAAEKEQKPAKPTAPKAAEKPARPEKTERAPRPERAEKPQRTERPEKKEIPAIDLPLCEDDNARRIVDFVSGLLEHMDSAAQVKVYEMEKGRYKVILEGDKLGQLIGRRGETLDALQYLTSLQVNKGREGYIRVTLDTENYRAKREDSLRRLAQRMANRAVKTGRKVVLEPMNPYERRVLHTALQNHPAVTTHSEGEEPNRRVVIMLKNQPERPEKSADKPQGEKPNRSRRSRRRGPRKPVNPAENQTANEPQETVAAPESPAAVDVLGVEE